MIQVLVLTEGDKDAFADSVSSFRKNLKTSYRLEWIVYCKKQDDGFREWALQNFPWLSDVKCNRYQMREAWDSINPNADYVVEFSDAFELADEFDVDATIAFIDDHPCLAQLSLNKERAEGEALTDTLGREWVQSAVKWTRSPSLYRRAITDMGWPIGRVPEERMTTKLLRNSKSWRSASLETDFVVIRNA